MAISDPHILEVILKQCATAAPEPWYPSAYAKSNGVVRDSLDEPLERLRLAGLVQLTDWVKGHGQGYRLTPQGQEVLQTPRDLQRLQNGQVPHRKTETDDRPRAEAAAFERSEAAREALSGEARPVITQILLALNVLVFIAGIVLAQYQGGREAASYFMFQADEQNDDARKVMSLVLLDTGGLWGVYLLLGQWWRLLTACFVHAGLIHLAVNMYALFALGPRGELLWGKWRFLILYLLSGLAGSCAAMVAGPNLVVGASGALCGLFAAEGAWLYLNRSHVAPLIVSAWARSLFLNALIVAVVVPMMFKQVSNAGHFGGALGGLATGALLHAGRFGGRWQRWLAALGLVGFATACIGVMYWAINTEAAWVLLRQALAREEAANSPQGEAQNFRMKGVAGVLRVTPVVWKTYQEAKPLVIHPGQRTPDRVKGAIAALASARADVDRVVASLEQSGPYKTESFEEGRQRGREFMTSLAELCRRAEHCLRDSKNPAEDEADMLNQEADARRKERAFKEVWDQIVK